MMTPSVTLLAEREQFVHQWRQALSEHDIDFKVVPPGNLANACSGATAVIVDADLVQDEGDDLLSTLGFVRASGVSPVAHLGASGAGDDIVEEVCQGLVVREPEDVSWVAAAIARRADRQRHLRFEFVTVSPCSDEVLAVVGNGDASLHRRPIDAADDGSDITQITIDPSATKATLRLESGAVCQLTVASVHRGTGASNGQNDIAIDGERLGARLRELRLAAGLTQAELSRRTGIHRPNIARVEAGRHTPSLETLARIANAIGVSTTQVLVSREP
jgi:DNA-binding XRE family transcriptional regulator